MSPSCLICGSPGPDLRRGLCRRHYEAARRRGQLEDYPLEPRKPPKEPISCRHCGEDGKPNEGRGLCPRCHKALARAGRLLEYPTTPEALWEDYSDLRGVGVDHLEVITYRVPMSPDTARKYLRRWEEQAA